MGSSKGRTAGPISIHALRGEGDPSGREKAAGPLVISIHALRGEGDPIPMTFSHRANISIHALRGEGDVFFSSDILTPPISIHALRGEGDLQKAAALQP